MIKKESKPGPGPGLEFGFDTPGENEGFRGDLPFRWQTHL